MSSKTRLRSASEVANEGLLLVCLNRTFAVTGANPTDRFAWRLAAQDGETGKRCTGTAVAAITANLDAFARPSPVKQRLKRHDNQNWIVWDPEVGPVQVLVGPWRPPPLVEI